MNVPASSSAPTSMLAPLSDAAVEVVVTRRAGGARRDLGFWVDTAVLLGVTAAGLLCPWGVGRWYAALLTCFAAIAAPVLAGCALVTWISERSTDRLQGPRRRPTLIARGFRETVVAAWIGATFAAWALSRSWAGLPIGLVWHADEAGGFWVAVGQTAAGLLALDAWLYWKHRILHTRALFAFHRAHHGYRDPTAFSGFAVGPVESVMTFWPTVLVAIPAAKHWAPLYFALIGGFIVLNLYLHCGARSRLIEATLPKLLVNTSVFHNVHHANAEVNFGESSFLWDLICRTRLADKRAAAAAARAA